MDEKKKIEFEYAIKQRNFEIELFWKRSWFFGVLVIAMVSGLYTLKKDKIFSPVFLSFILFLTILAQCLMNRGSKYWHERWEYMTKNRESSYGIKLTNLKKFSEVENDEWYYIEACILAKGENFLTRSVRWSVSKLTILIWDILFIFSFLNWINEFIIASKIELKINFLFEILGVHTIIIIYIVLFITRGKVYANDRNKVFIANFKKLEEDYVNDNLI